MSSLSEEEVIKLQWNVIDINIVPDQYVTYIVDMWEGNLKDPATTVIRYIGVWRAETIDALTIDEEGNVHDREPDFSKCDYSEYRYSYSRGVRAWGKYDYPPIVWEEIEHTKEADKAAKEMREEYKNLTSQEKNYYGSSSTHRDLFNKFIVAIDVLAEDYENEEAWADVDRYRRYQALKHEK